MTMTQHALADGSSRPPIDSSLDTVPDTFETDQVSEMFRRPSLVFTISPGLSLSGDSEGWAPRQGQDSAAVEVLKALKRIQGESGDEARVKQFRNVDVRVFASEARAQAYFLEHRLDPTRAVCVFEGSPRGYFTFTASDRTSGGKMPSWACGAHWGLEVCSRRRRADNAAYQIRANFSTHFERQLGRGEFPWGPLRSKERASLQQIRFNRGRAAEIVSLLNEGPDEAATLAHSAHGRRLPRGQRFSWLRVPDQVARFPGDRFRSVLDVIAASERAGAQLVREDPTIRDLLLQGVTIDPVVRDAYLDPHFGSTPITEWSVRRPDLHVDGMALAASENDEMPGGFIDAYFLDRAYGVNQTAWDTCLEQLTQFGPVVFVVSSEWSAAYQNGIRSFCEHMQDRGFAFDYVMSEGAETRFQVREGGVFIDGNPIGTIWRLFPIFETTGFLADLVLASQAGLVRMAPEFAHFGNKTWFTIFRHRMDDFRRIMGDEQVALLDEVMPFSRMVSWNDGDPVGLPLTLADGSVIDGWKQLIELDKGQRDDLVLKVTGASAQTARSHGVFVGHANGHRDWADWLEAQRASEVPFLVQRKFGTSEHRVPVLNTGTGAVENFAAKVLLRPWVVRGSLVSVPATCTPHTTTKVHGMVDMAMVPVHLM